ncbi:hypothetical protein PCIT_a2200 [Pseudoalteromonas citrea]|uniref:Uncharacterized protein n=1 Tax=Pseudoalteromonas citrea TaxID=43655 RepID=A0AAD4FSF4_9GAMM|nr:hypothetical protein PCIT_a2200 [Pseudoalteromonas citrea]
MRRLNSTGIKNKQQSYKELTFCVFFDLDLDLLPTEPLLTVY